MLTCRQFDEIVNLRFHFRIYLSYWEKPYCSFPWPFYISLFAVNWVNLRFSSDFGNTVYYNLTNYMVISWCASDGFVRWSQISVDDHLTCCYKCCWFFSVLTIIPHDTSNVSGYTRAVVARFCECISLTCTNSDGILSVSEVLKPCVVWSSLCLQMSWHLTVSGHQQTQGWMK